MRFAMIPTPWPEVVSELEAAGHEQVTDLNQADFVVYAGAPADLPKLPNNVGFVQCAYAGMDALREAGLLDGSVRWANAAGLYADSVAESTLGLMIGAGHRYKVVMAAGSWDVEKQLQETTRYLYDDATVLIVGAGGIAKRLIEMLEPFGTRVIAVNRSGRTVPGADETHSWDDLAAQWGRADFVVLLAPLTEETRGLVSTAELKAMRTSAFLVNTGRGGLIDTDALVEALRAGEISGAGLDVVDPEPLPDGHPLWELENCLITPHTANTRPIMHAELGALCVRNAELFAAGERMETEVDLDAGY